MFWNKKKNEQPSADSERTSKLLVEALENLSKLSRKVNEIEGLYNILKTDISNLRGIVNRKLSGKQLEQLQEEEKPKEEKKEEFINGGYIPFG